MNTDQRVFNRMDENTTFDHSIQEQAMNVSGSIILPDKNIANRFGVGSVYLALAPKH
jgi:hypothetical protein